jgi:hypothetical protein
MEGSLGTRLSRKMLSRWWAWSGKGVIILNKNKLLIKK